MQYHATQKGYFTILFLVEACDTTGKIVKWDPQENISLLSISFIRSKTKKFFKKKITEIGDCFRARLPIDGRLATRGSADRQRKSVM